jgi:hypothetical protein
VDANSIDALQVQLPGKEPAILSTQNYELLIDQFLPTVDAQPVMGGENWVENIASFPIEKPGISVEEVIGGVYEETIEEKFIRETGLKR